MKPKSAIGIEITTSSGCNCNCLYCFETSHCTKVDHEEEARQLKLLDDYCSRFDLNENDSLRITFWGGEPMMNLEYIKKIISTTIKYEFVNYYMYSNGTLFDSFRELASCGFAEELKNRIHI